MQHRPGRYRPGWRERWTGLLLVLMPVLALATLAELLRLPRRGCGGLGRFAAQLAGEDRDLLYALAHLNYRAERYTLALCYSERLLCLQPQSVV